MQLSDKQYQIAVVGLALVGVLAMTNVRYCGEFELPGKPAKPVVAQKNARDISDRIALSTGAYQGYLERDAKTFGIPRPRLAQMAAVFPYQVDGEKHLLAPGKSTEVLGMRLTLSVETIGGSSIKQMVLQIENLGHKPLAYRIQTRPSSGKSACARMKQIRHNSLALAGGGKIRRVECIFRKRRTLDITQVETIELPELGYLYLSSMDAGNFGIEQRTAKKHEVPLPSMRCRVHQTASLRHDIVSGRVQWRDQAEFYARHGCQTYSFSGAFKAFTKNGERTLPAGGGDL